MEQTLKGDEHGWWVVSHNSQVWLPEGKLPHGTAAQCGLEGIIGRQIGEWHGECVWLVSHQKTSQMDSVRELLDEDVALFQLAGRSVQLAEFYRSHQFCGYCGQKMVHSKTELACLCPHVKSGITHKSPRV